MDRFRTSSPFWPPSSSANHSFTPARKITSSARHDLPPARPAPAFPRFSSGPPGWTGRPGRPTSHGHASIASIASLPSFGHRTSVDQVSASQLRPGTSAAPGGPVSSLWRVGEISCENATLQRSPAQDVNRVSLNCVSAPSGLQEIEKGSLETAMLKFSIKERHSARITDSATQKNSNKLATSSLHDVNNRKRLKGSIHQADGHALDFHTTPRMLLRSEPTRNTAGGSFCGFCKKNGELASTYASHSLRSTRPDGSVYVSCPILRDLKCKICGASEDMAHTQSHCPQAGRYCLPVAVLLKSTARRCDGTLRLKDHRKS